MSQSWPFLFKAICQTRRGHGRPAGGACRSGGGCPWTSRVRCPSPSMKHHVSDGQRRIWVTRLILGPALSYPKGRSAIAHSSWVSARTTVTSRRIVRASFDLVVDPLEGGGRPDLAPPRTSPRATPTVVRGRASNSPSNELGTTGADSTDRTARWPGDEPAQGARSATSTARCAAASDLHQHAREARRSRRHLAYPPTRRVAGPDLVQGRESGVSSRSALPSSCPRPALLVREGQDRLPAAISSDRGVRVLRRPLVRCRRTRGPRRRRAQR